MLPLHGLRVLAISQYGAGPFATLQLADLGAEVIKIEDPRYGGDMARYVPPFQEGTDSLFFQALNRNKKSLTLNLKTEKGKEIFHRLVQISDAVFNNLRGDQPHKLGLDYDSLQGYNPKIVCCSLSGFGLTGPLAAEPGYDYLMQGMSGIMNLTGAPDTPPTKAGISIIDFSGSYLAIFGLMAGIFAARETGKGCNVDVGLLDGAVSMLNYLAAWHLNGGYTPEKTFDSAHPSIVPSQVFPTKDGYIVIMCNKEKFFTQLCAAIEHPELAEDERFNNFAARLKNKDVLIPLLKGILATKSTAQWLERFRGLVPAAPVNSFAQAFTEPQVLAREMIVEVDHPQYGTLKEVGCPIKITGEDFVYQRAPGLGEHTEQILQDYLGLTGEEIQALRAAQIV
ncbi:MAG: CaiB/BaiF CoA transferase family protein [bacterium]|jgi:crotonobetainyl-CoA:carnitine CoA-transferase CaiB-like acyl-CoA transferase